MLFIWTLKFCWLILWNECSQVFEMNTIPFHENVHTKLNYFSFFWSYGFWHFQSILHSSGYQFIRSFGFGLQDELALCCIFEVLEQTQWTIINWWSIQKTNYYFFCFHFDQDSHGPNKFLFPWLRHLWKILKFFK